MVDLIDLAHFRLLGRADTVINTGGVKIQPELVEQVIGRVLGEYGLNWRNLIVGVADDQFGQRVTALIEVPDRVVSDQFSAIWQVAEETIRQQIGRYAVPKDVFIVPNFVETATGKIDRRATMAAHLDQSAA